MTKDKRWSGYYDAVANQPVRQSLLTGLSRWESVGRPPGFAIDLGCGSGRDTFELLRRGWQVLAIDKEREAMERLSHDLPPDYADQLSIQVSLFEGLMLPTAQLINASFSLPFCHPDHFDALWEEIIASLEGGGIFVGQLFGDHDDWAGSDEMTFHSRPQLDERLAGFDVISLTETDEDGSTATGKAKHWHYFEIVAAKM